MPPHVEAALLGWMLSGTVGCEASSAMMSGGAGLRLRLSCDQTEFAIRGLVSIRITQDLEDPQSATPTVSPGDCEVNPLRANLWPHFSGVSSHMKPVNAQLSNACSR